MESPQLNDEHWQEIDPLILQNQKMRCLIRIRELMPLGLHEALDVFVERYKELRAEKPDEFTESDEKYWDGFYS